MRGRSNATLTLITGSGQRTGTRSGESASGSYDRLICAGIEQVLAEAMTEIFDVDLAHFVGELRNGYRDVLIDIVEDCLRAAPCAQAIRFEGKGTFELDWNVPPMVRLEFTWQGPWYEVVFFMVREGMRKYCTLDKIRIEPGQDRTADEAAAHILTELWSQLGRHS
jgi:hypothetical protein